jgi:hypothetical protein
VWIFVTDSTAVKPQVGENEVARGHMPKYGIVQIPIGLTPVCCSLLVLAEDLHRRAFCRISKYKSR